VTQSFDLEELVVTDNKPEWRLVTVLHTSGDRNIMIDHKASNTRRLVKVSRVTENEEHQKEDQAIYAITVTGSDQTRYVLRDFASPPKPADATAIRDAGVKLLRELLSPVLYRASADVPCEGNGMKIQKLATEIENKYKGSWPELLGAYLALSSGPARRKHKYVLRVAFDSAKSDDRSVELRRDTLISELKHSLGPSEIDVVLEEPADEQTLRVYVRPGR